MSIINSCFAAFIVVFSVSSSPKATATFATFAPETQRSANVLYGQRCSKCHGVDGRAQTSKGRFNHARDLADPKWQDDVTDERIFNSIMNGRNVRGSMPAFGDTLSEAEVNELVKFVRGLRK